jgi:hypothetical protein
MQTKNIESAPEGMTEEEVKALPYPDQMVNRYFDIKDKLGDLVSRVIHPDIGQNEVCLTLLPLRILMYI